MPVERVNDDDENEKQKSLRGREKRRRKVEGNLSMEFNWLWPLEPKQALVRPNCRFTFGEIAQLRTGWGSSSLGALMGPLALVTQLVQ